KESLRFLPRALPEGGQRGPRPLAVVPAWRGRSPVEIVGEGEIVVGGDEGRAGGMDDVVLKHAWARAERVLPIRQRCERDGWIPVDGVVVDLAAVDHAVVPRLQVDVALRVRIGPAVVRADVVADDAVGRGQAPGAEDRHAVAIRVVAVVVLNRGVRASPVDVEDAAVAVRRMRAVALVELDDTVGAGERP